MLGVLAYTLGSDSAGHALEVSPVNALMITVPLYSSCLLAMVGTLLLARRAVPRLRVLIASVVAVLAPLVIVLTYVDLAMQRFRGERLTLSILKTYLTPDAVSGDWVQPFLEYRRYAALQLFLLVASLVAVSIVLWRWLRRRDVVTESTLLPSGIGALVLSVACYAPLRFAYDHQRDMGAPTELVLARALLLPSKVWLSAERRRGERDAWRASMDSIERNQWLSDSFPLMRRTAVRPVAFADSLPDIVFFVVESLRGADVGYGLRPRVGSASVTPELDALARQSVVFTNYIASGEPSPRGFITIQTGEWEHKDKFTLTSFPNVQTDAIPARLRTLGYHTMALWGGNPAFDNQLAWARRWYDELVFDLPENRLFYFKTMPDGVLMNRFMERVRVHDSVAPNQPLFAYVASNGTHTPFTLDSGSTIPGDSVPSPDRQRRYDLCLANIDAEIGRVVRFLKARRHGANTVIVVVGDHSDRTNEAVDARWRGMPVDASVWTAALVHAPERLVGKPRHETFVASHVDLLPTIRAFTGDTSPTSSAGHDLFDSIPDAQRRAVSINARGYRLDWQGFTLLVNPYDLRAPYAFKTFANDNATPVPLSQTPFASDEAERLVRRIEYWSELVEADRVWSGALAGRRRE